MNSTLARRDRRIRPGLNAEHLNTRAMTGKTVWKLVDRDEVSRAENTSRTRAD